MNTAPVIRYYGRISVKLPVPLQEWYITNLGVECQVLGILRITILPFNFYQRERLHYCLPMISSSYDSRAYQHTKNRLQYQHVNTF